MESIMLNKTCDEFLYSFYQKVPSPDLFFHEKGGNVVGKIKGNEFYILIEPYTGNMFATYLFGRIENNTIYYRFDKPVSYKIISVIFLIGLVLMMVIIIADFDEKFMVLLPAFMMILVLFDLKHHNKRKEEKLLQFLKELAS